MANLSEIVSFSNSLLNVEKFKDYCPNGLQIEGSANVDKIVSGVTASQALIDGAIGSRAEIILVHHGFFWRGENPVIVGLKKKRIAALLRSNVSLLVYHLPLDAHEQCGNNVQLAKRLSLRVLSNFGLKKNDLGIITEAGDQFSASDFCAHIQSVLGRMPTHISANKNKIIKKIGICTGGAQDYFESAINAGVDAFVTGEVSEQCFHLAMESGVDFFAAGHHATERYGVQALGELLSKKFDLKHEYLEVDNPI